VFDDIPGVLTLQPLPTEILSEDGSPDLPLGVVPLDVFWKENLILGRGDVVVVAGIVFVDDDIIDEPPAILCLYLFGLLDESGLKIKQGSYCLFLTFQY
jgi:hypothetical protein